MKQNSKIMCYFSNRYGTILSNIIIQIILQFIDLIHTSRVVRKKLGFKLQG